MSYVGVPLGEEEETQEFEVLEKEEQDILFNPFAVNFSGERVGENDVKSPMPMAGTGQLVVGTESNSWWCQECCGVDNVDAPFERRKKMCWTALEVGTGTTFCFWFERIIHNPFCNWLFKCGCTWNWDGGWNRCNVFNTVGAPKCPWCTAASNVSWTTDHFLFALMTLTFLFLLRHRKRVDMVVRWTAPIVVYFGVGTLIGWIFKVTGSYPIFIW